jgi:peptidoglycan/xylan/chitin deacetylase (PgdA/CDA1 family)
MNVVKFVLGHRGPSNLVKRSVQIATRFGSGPQRMGGRFERFMDILDEVGIRPTFPITALPMSRNPKFAHRLIDRGAELAVHAWSHIDLSALDLAGQREHMGRAVDLFRSCSVPFTGFRAPYLHWNEDTMRVVGEFQFRYSSNQTVWWDVIDPSPLDADAKEGLARGRAFYRPIPATEFRVLPFRRDGFIEIPVSLPDDEIPLDRMYIHDAGYLAGMWRRIFDLSYGAASFSRCSSIPSASISSPTHCGDCCRMRVRANRRCGLPRWTRLRSGGRRRRRTARSSSARETTSASTCRRAATA